MILIEFTCPACGHQIVAWKDDLISEKTDPRASVRLQCGSEKRAGCGWRGTLPLSKGQATSA